MHPQLTKEDRKAIEYYLHCNWTYKRIGLLLCKDRGTIRREVERNSCPDGVYRYGAAHKRYLARRKKAKYPQLKLHNDASLRRKVIYQLRKLHAPEQISGRLKRKGILLSHETIYRWIYEKRPDLQEYLRCTKGKFRRKRGTKKRAKQRRLIQFRSIDERPAVVNERTRLGDWEGDTVIGSEKTERILTHVERKSGYGVADLLLRVTAPLVAEVTVKRMQSVPLHLRKTITYDRGTEFGGDDTLLEKNTNTKVYRAHPYHSWERGSNENWNGLLRQFFPKGTDFSILTQNDVDRAVHNLNHRPRKRLHYLTPHEVFVLGKIPENEAPHT